jgi:hypothetical protein
MIAKEDWKLFVFVLAILILTLVRSLFTNGSSVALDSTVKLAPAIGQPNRQLSPPILETVRRSSELIADAGGLDQTATAPGKKRLSAGKAGSAETGRALAVARSAIADAVKAVVGSEKRDRSIAPQAIVAVIAETANVTMTDLFPPQAAKIDGGVIKEGTRIGTQETAGADVVQLPAEAESSNSTARGRIGVIASIKLREDPISRFLRALSAHPEEAAPSS